MSSTKSAYYANPNRPGIALRAVLNDPLAVAQLQALRSGPLALSTLAPSLTERQVLRRLVRLDLVSAYRLDGVTRYRLRRSSPGVGRLLGGRPVAA